MNIYQREEAIMNDSEYTKSNKGKLSCTKEVPAYTGPTEILAGRQFPVCTTSHLSLIVRCSGLPTPCPSSNLRSYRYRKYGQGLLHFRSVPLQPVCPFGGKLPH